MTPFWLRRALIAATCVGAVLVAGCGSGTIESALQPARFIAFGDGISDVGTPRLTVNDGSINIWSQQLASRYGLPLASSASGGLGFARAHARVTLQPDAVGASAPSLRQQIDAFQAANSIGANDVVLVQGGVSDILVQMAAVLAGTQTEAQMTANVRQAGRDMGAQVRRLVQAGGRFVIVTGSYNLGTSPWATAIGRNAFLADVSRFFNEEMLISIVDLGANVLYIDSFFYYNLVTAAPTNFGLQNSVAIACSSVDPGVGIGIGSGQVSSALCTPGTIAAGIDFAQLVFADRVYLTPIAQRLLGDFAFSRVVERF